MYYSQNKKKSLNINKFQSLSPPYKSCDQYNEFTNFDTITERKYIPLIYTKYKPYSQYRKTQQNITKLGDYFNSTIEQISFQQQYKQKGQNSLTPKRKTSLKDRIITEPFQTPKSNDWKQQTFIKEFSINLPDIQENQRQGNVLKKKKRIIGLRISLK